MTAIHQLMREDFAVGRVLIIAPLRVAQTVWDAEIDKWEHLKGLRVSKILGDREHRQKAMNAEADIYVINRENVPWLIEEIGNRWPWDMVVIDELSSFKSRSAERWKALRRVRGRFTRVVGLTGTPAPNGLIDLWPQVYLLDRGKALGTTLGGYRDEYFRPGRSNGHVVYEWRLKPGSEERIYQKLDGLCVSMKAKDHLRMPERIDNYIKVQLDEQTKKCIAELERDYVLQLGDTEIMAPSAATVSNKLLQLAQGAIYDEDGGYHVIHDAKLDALQDVIEAANGQSVLVYYSFKFDLERILQRFPEAVELKGEREVKRWNEGKIPILVAHPASAGHGLNLQAGGSLMVWYGLPWSLELYEQANARLYRQGQRQAVVIHHLAAEGTIDEDVIRSLGKKEEAQRALFEALKARIDKWT